MAEAMNTDFLVIGSGIIGWPRASWRWLAPRC